MIRLTAHGTNSIKEYLAELSAKRKEILDAGKDTADNAQLPTIQDIIDDISEPDDDSGYEYIGDWGVTDHYGNDGPLRLRRGVDYMVDVQFTERGHGIVNSYLKHLMALRTSILAVGKDTADDTELPTEDDIKCDINLWDDGDRDSISYVNSWNVTDNISSDIPLGLQRGRDYTFNWE